MCRPNTDRTRPTPTHTQRRDLRTDTDDERDNTDEQTASKHVNNNTTTVGAQLRVPVTASVCATPQATCVTRMPFSAFCSINAFTTRGVG